MNKEFKEVPGFEGFYKCDKKGRVYSHFSKRLLKPIKTKNNNIYGYTLSKCGIPYKMSCARVVALTFLENPNPKLYKYVIHKDGDLSNYSLENIEWGSSSHSVISKNKRYPLLLDKFMNSRMPPKSKFSNKDVIDMKKYRFVGYSLRQIADIYGCSKQTVANLINKQDGRR